MNSPETRLSLRRGQWGAAISSWRATSDPGFVLSQLKGELGRLRETQRLVEKGFAELCEHRNILFTQLRGEKAPLSAARAVAPREVVLGSPTPRRFIAPKNFCLQNAVKPPKARQTRPSTTRNSELEALFRRLADALCDDGAEISAPATSKGVARLIECVEAREKSLQVKLAQSTLANGIFEQRLKVLSAQKADFEAKLSATDRAKSDFSMPRLIGKTVFSAQIERLATQRQLPHTDTEGVETGSSRAVLSISEQKQTRMAESGCRALADKPQICGKALKMRASECGRRDSEAIIAGLESELREAERCLAKESNRAIEAEKKLSFFERENRSENAKTFESAENSFAVLSQNISDSESARANKTKTALSELVSAEKSARAATQNISLLTEQLAHTKRKLVAAETQIRENESRFASAEKKTALSEQTLAVTLKELREAKKRFSLCEEMLAVAERELREEKWRAAQYEACVAETTERIRLAEKKLFECEARAAAFEAENAENARLATSLKSQIAKVCEKLRGAESDLAANEKREVETREKLESELRKAECRAKASEDKAYETEKSLALAELKVIAGENRIETCEQDNALKVFMLENEFLAAKETFENAQKTFLNDEKRLQNQLFGVETALAEQKSLGATLEAKAKTLAEENAILNAKLREANETEKSLKTEFEASKCALNRAFETRSANQSDFANVKSQFSAPSNEQSKFRAQIDDLARRVERGEALAALREAELLSAISEANANAEKAREELESRAHEIESEGDALGRAARSLGEKFIEVFALLAELEQTLGERTENANENDFSSLKLAFGAIAATLDRLEGERAVESPDAFATQLLHARLRARLDSAARRQAAIEKELGERESAERERFAAANDALESAERQIANLLEEQQILESELCEARLKARKCERVDSVESYDLRLRALLEAPCESSPLAAIEVAATQIRARIFSFESRICDLLRERARCREEIREFCAAISRIDFLVVALGEAFEKLAQKQEIALKGIAGKLAQIEDFSEERRAFRDKIVEQSKEIEFLIAEIAGKSKENETLCKKNDEHSKEISDKSKESCALRAKIEEQSNEINAFCVKFNEKENEIDVLRKEITDKSNESEKLENKIAEQADKIDELFAKTTEQWKKSAVLQVQIAEQSKENEALRTKITEQSHEIDALHIKLAENAHEIDASHAKIVDRSKENDALQLKPLDQSEAIDALHVKITEQSTEIGALHVKMTEQSNEIAALHFQIDEKAKESENLSTKTYEHSKESDELRAKIAEQSSENDFLNFKITEQSEEIDAFQLKIDKQANENTDLRLQLTQQLKEIDVLRTEAESQLKRNNDLHLRITEKSKESDAFHAKMAKHLRDETALQWKLDDKLKEINALRIKTDEISKQKDYLKLKINEQSEQINNFRQTFTEQSQKTDTLNAKIAEQSKEILILYEQLVEYQQKIVELNSEIKSAETTLNNYCEISLENSNSLTERLKTAFRVVSERFSARQNSILHALKARFASLGAEIIAAREKLASFATENAIIFAELKSGFAATNRALALSREAESESKRALFECIETSQKRFEDFAAGNLRIGAENECAREAILSERVEENLREKKAIWTARAVSLIHAYAQSDDSLKADFGDFEGESIVAALAEQKMAAQSAETRSRSILNARIEELQSERVAILTSLSALKPEISLSENGIAEKIRALFAEKSEEIDSFREDLHRSDREAAWWAATAREANATVKTAKERLLKVSFALKSQKEEFFIAKNDFSSNFRAARAIFTSLSSQKTLSIARGQNSANLSINSFALISQSNSEANLALKGLSDTAASLEAMLASNAASLERIQSITPIRLYIEGFKYSVDELARSEIGARRFAWKKFAAFAFSAPSRRVLQQSLAQIRCFASRRDALVGSKGDVLLVPRAGSPLPEGFGRAVNPSIEGSRSLTPLELSGDELGEASCDSVAISL